MAKIDIEEIETKWKKFWEEEQIYKADLTVKEIFSIDTPPPTISGHMHIGHAFSYSQQDFIARFRRMYNGSVLYPFGTDDNGLPTERYVEKIHNLKSESMSRADFIKLCSKTLKELTPDFIHDWKDIGMSCDFEVYYSTIDKNSQKISQASFINLYKKGYVYKKSFPTLWCTECKTSIAQAELEDKEGKTLFSTLKFKIQNKDLLIATTRPELLGACTAIFVNPKDTRYKTFIGKKAIVPLFNFEVPIIADDSAQIDKGTGALMICSYGDKYDVEAINRHGLKPRIIINLDGTLNIEPYKGLKIKDARKKILEDLKNAGLIYEQKEINHIVNVHDRCSNPIEFIATEQWFIKLLDYKKELINQGNKIKWYPEFMKKRYENWVNGLEWDWSISRERHFGVPIPVWTCKECNEIILPSENKLPIDPLEIKKICPKCKKEAIGENRVFDTWMTSSESPQIVSSLTNNKIKIPFSFRPQAHDIIRTWAFYTIVKSFLNENKLPWNDIVISGHVTLKGEKMSKSKGNVIAPKDIIKEYGVDTMRFAAASSKLGNDSDYSENDLITGKKLVNKLLNASRFVFMNLKDFNNTRPKTFEKLDELFLEKLNILINKTTDDFKNYEYSKVKQEIEQFFMNDFCNNYLEIVKKRVYQGSVNEKHSAQYTLYTSLLAMLKIFAPIMPFITEEIYQEHFRIFEKSKSIHVTSWPKYKKSSIDALDELPKYQSLIDVLEDVRREKTNMQKPMNAECNLIISEKTYDKIKDMIEDLKSVTNAQEIKSGKEFKISF